MLSLLFFVRKFHRAVGRIICPSQLKGLDHLMDSRLNKDLAFTLEERKTLGIHGLTPPCFKTAEEQLKLAAISVNAYHTPLNKYVFMMDLQDMNECLFYRFLRENIEHLMPIVYKPTVGLACQRFSLIYRRPRGLFVSIHDRHHVLDVIKNWPETDVRVVCVTDGENVLGLGDVGVAGMGVSVGRAALFTAIGGVKPNYTLPVCLDVGTNNQELLNDPLYIGQDEKRVCGIEYVELVDEFMRAVVQRWGPKTLVQFEGFNYANGLDFLHRYRSSYCTYNDDIQGEACVTLAALFATTRITGKRISEYTFLFVGAGAASLNLAHLLVKSIVSKEISKEQALKKIWFTDINGLLTTNSTEEELKGKKVKYAKEHEPITNLEDIVAKIKPDVIIGATRSPGIFTPKLLNTMAANCERPIIFPLSTPREKVECTAEEAYQNTDGRAIFSSKVAFEPVTVNDRTFVPRYSYNAYLFPGLVMAIISTSMYHVSDDMFVIAACELSKCVEESELQRGSLFPPTSKIIEINRRIALVVIDLAYEQGVASLTPKPNNIAEWLKGESYSYHYKPSLPSVNPWPKPPEMKVKEIHPIVASVHNESPEAELDHWEELHATEPDQKRQAQATTPFQKGQAQATSPDQKEQAQATTPHKKGQPQGTGPYQKGQAQATAQGQKGQVQATAPAQKGKAHTTASEQKEQAQETTADHKGQAQAKAPAQMGKAQAKAPARDGEAQAAAPSEQKGQAQVIMAAADQKGQAQVKAKDQQEKIEAKATDKKGQVQEKPPQEKYKKTPDPKKPGTKKT